MSSEIPLKLVRASTNVMSALHTVRLVLDEEMSHEREYDPDRRSLTLSLEGKNTSVELLLQEDGTIDTRVRGDGKLARAFASVLEAPHYDSTGNLISTPEVSTAKKDTPSLWSGPFDRCFAEHGDPASSWDSLPSDQRLAVSIGVYYTQIKRNGFMFWIINGYVKTFTEEVLHQLDDLGTPQAKTARSLVVEAREIDARAAVLEPLADGGDLDAERELDDFADRCEDMDDLFDERCKTLMDDVDARLAAMESACALRTPAS